MIDQEIKFNNWTISNRVVAQPMEGCDCNEDGSPSELTKIKYVNNAKNGAGIIWFEATAVLSEGRTNPRQMMITKENIDSFKKLVLDIKNITWKKFGFEPFCVLQLTHSGRQSINPMIAYRNFVYEQTRPVSDANIVTDNYLDKLPDAYLSAALLAKQAGFDAVDVKSCHGYLLQELLSAFNRPGKYGGSFKNRTKTYLNCIDIIKNNVLDIEVVTRLGISDMVAKPNGFGTDNNNKLDLTEPYLLLEELKKRDIKLVNITLGNPYYNPHINRPYRKGGYIPQESAKEGLLRFYKVGKTLKEKFPDMLFINSALSYYRDDMIEKAEELLQNKCADFVGFGRVTLAYPQFYSDYLLDKFNGKKCCMACSKCTDLMRGKQVSGCAVFNEYYKKLYKEKIQCVKK